MEFFFFFGWLFSFSFIFIIILLNSKIQLFYNDSNENQQINQKKEGINDKKTVGMMLILYIAFFLGCSDYLFMFFVFRILLDNGLKIFFY